MIKWKIDNPTDKGSLSEAFVKEICETYDGKGGVAFDIGANIGEYTKFLAKRFDRVYAFEAFPDTALTLSANLKGNCKNVIIVNKAVANESTLAKFWIVGDGKDFGGNTLSQNVAEQEQWGHRLQNFTMIQTVTIDEYVKEHNINNLKFMKVDVEGAENFMFLGAINTLTSMKLDIILEVHRCVDLVGLFKFFDDLGYSAFNSDYRKVTTFKHDCHYFITNKV